ncbi:hypothetical protein JNUCC1_00875 [Lentibacillus sp. JNUCC-1]|uniref:PH domain-containing protein n=1 Tax=Lentibacillus sp. JNUCC-1 TaxID=2654513 RepID=UPI0012E96F25|nr:PH domain-containing protein [Lentibacillus sp. JNUCC-1]MUV37069.1 hypothetical protein [Lentibacillus sp. JNUCC-1]
MKKIREYLVDVAEEQLRDEVNTTSFTKSELELLPIILEDGETVHRVMSGRADQKLGKLMATNKRVIYLRTYSAGSSDMETFYFGEIQSITQNKTKGLSGQNVDLTFTDITGYAYTVYSILNFSVPSFLEYVHAMNDQ